MINESRIPDAETRAKNLASLRAAVHQLDMANLMLDEAIALADRDLLQQRRARLLHKSNSMPIDRIEN
jgi:exonuclease VII small subunit